MASAARTDLAISETPAYRSARVKRRRPRIQSPPTGHTAAQLPELHLVGGARTERRCSPMRRKANDTFQRGASPGTTDAQVFRRSGACGRPAHIRRSTPAMVGNVRAGMARSASLPDFVPAVTPGREWRGRGLDNRRLWRSGRDPDDVMSGRRGFPGVAAGGGGGAGGDGGWPWRQPRLPRFGWSRWRGRCSAETVTPAPRGGVRRGESGGRDSDRGDLQRVTATRRSPVVTDMLCALVRHQGGATLTHCVHCWPSRAAGCRDRTVAACAVGLAAMASRTKARNAKAFKSGPKWGRRRPRPLHRSLPPL
jgi:hypothetical protein